MRSSAQRVPVRGRVGLQVGLAGRTHLQACRCAALQGLYEAECWQLVQPVDDLFPRDAIERCLAPRECEDPPQVIKVCAAAGQRGGEHGHEAGAQAARNVVQLVAIG